jgi:hypothetical protein
MKAKEFSSPTFPLRLSRRLLTSFSDLTFLHNTGQLASALPVVGNPEPVGKGTIRSGFESGIITSKKDFFKQVWQYGQI